MMTSNESEFQLAIHNALCSCLGLSPSSEQALSLIRQAYTRTLLLPRPVALVGAGPFPDPAGVHRAGKQSAAGTDGGCDLLVPVAGGRGGSGVV